MTIILTICGGLIYSLNNYPKILEKPLIRLGLLTSLLFDKPSPSDWVNEKQILIYPDKVVILVEGASISTYAPTKSMDPVLDETVNGISIKPTSPEQLKEGDIISFYPYEGSEYLIVHRIIKIGKDEKGWFAITKGDNSFQEDGKVRFEQIKYVLIALIY